MEVPEVHYSIMKNHRIFKDFDYSGSCSLLCIETRPFSLQFFLSLSLMEQHFCNKKLDHQS